MDNDLTTLANNYGIASKIPIYLYINSNGGFIYAANKAIDCIAELNNPIYTVAHGMVASAATLLLVVGTKRFIKPNGYLLLHELSNGAWHGGLEEFKDNTMHYRELMKIIKDMYIKNSKLTSKQLDRILKHDAIWDATESIKYGLVDKVYYESHESQSKPKK